MCGRQIRPQQRSRIRSDPAALSIGSRDLSGSVSIRNLRTEGSLAFVDKARWHPAQDRPRLVAPAQSWYNSLLVLYTLQPIHISNCLSLKGGGEKDVFLLLSVRPTSPNSPSIVVMAAQTSSDLP